MLTRATNRPPCLAPNCEQGICGWPRATRGFTLLETLVALSMLTLILGAAYGSYRAVTGSIVDLEPRLDLHQKGRFFIQKLSRQIRCCYGGRGDQAARSAPDRNDVNEPALREQMRFFQGGLAASDDVMLRFVTTSRRLNRKSDIVSLAVVTYKMDALQHALLTCEQAYGRRTSGGDENWRAVLENVAEIEFQYFDGKDWRQRWDSQVEGGLPRAVRVAIVQESRQNHASARFTSIVPIRCFSPGRPNGQDKADRKVRADAQ
ncbi:MAG: prepilin-type N-terminal cleavage/methylation domain-containing protein [Sedimentisphaerales bacterium]|nr:prepilin-type N-terminal cleavage/methylation domain-containing protein [Sedimentisphaerales bacterium]